MMIILVGYICGFIHKILNNNDVVTYLYAFNFFIISIDLVLYFTYIGQNKRDLLHKNAENITKT